MESIKKLIKNIENVTHTNYGDMILSVYIKILPKEELLNVLKQINDVLVSQE
jgi:hypothetical protein